MTDLYYYEMGEGTLSLGKKSTRSLKKSSELGTKKIPYDDRVKSNQEKTQRSSTKKSDLSSSQEVDIILPKGSLELSKVEKTTFGATVFNAKDHKGSLMEPALFKEINFAKTQNKRYIVIHHGYGGHVGSRKIAGTFLTLWSKGGLLTKLYDKNKIDGWRMQRGNLGATVIKLV